MWGTASYPHSTQWLARLDKLLLSCRLFPSKLFFFHQLHIVDLDLTTTPLRLFHCWLVCLFRLPEPQPLPLSRPTLLLSFVCVCLSVSLFALFRCKLWSFILKIKFDFFFSHGKPKRLLHSRSQPSRLVLTPSVTNCAEKKQLRSEVVLFSVWTQPHV